MKNKGTRGKAGSMHSVFAVEGTKDYTGSKGVGYCDEACANCGCETYNIPNSRVSLCAHCGVEMFPCSDCDNRHDGCGWDSKTSSCHKFNHSKCFTYRKSLASKRKQLQKKISQDSKSYEKRMLQREKVDIYNDALKIAIACEWMYFFDECFMELFVDDEVNSDKLEQLLATLLTIPNIIDHFTELMLDDNLFEIDWEAFARAFRYFMEVKYNIDLV